MVPTHKCLPLQGLIQGIQLECIGGKKPNQEAVPGYNNGTNPKLNPLRMRWETIYIVFLH